MKDTYIKLLIGTVLFGTLVGLTVYQVGNDDRLLDLIYTSLVGLGIYHMKAPGEGIGVATPAKKEDGRALPGFLALLGLGSMLVLAGCQTNPNLTPQQSAQMTYTQACAAYGAALSGAVELRRAGKLSKSTIDQITLIDNQITPICTGPLPQDATTVTQQVTAAVTKITILELARTEQKP